MQALTDGQYASNRNLTNAYNAEIFWNRGRHAITFGGDYRRQQFNVLSQQDARGAFTFTGSATGSDLADFLLGIPHASSIAFGNADKYLRATGADAYIDDDWRLSPGLSREAGCALGVRGADHRVVRTSREPRRGAGVHRGQPGRRRRSGRRAHRPALSRFADACGPARHSAAPRRRVASGAGIVARRPRRLRRVPQHQRLPADRDADGAAAAAVEDVRASRTASRIRSRSRTDSSRSRASRSNTFAVDPDFRIGYAQNWQASVQRDLPASLTVLATYLGTRGSHLMQEFLPNTYPAGAANPCPACPAGFVYLTSNGRSTRHAGQIQVRRRLRNGLTATVQYQLAKASDDAGAFTGVSLNGAAIAQDWRNLGGRVGAVVLRSASPGDRAVPVHERRRRRRRHAAGWLERRAVEGLDRHGRAQRRQRSAAHAGVSHVGHREPA